MKVMFRILTTISIVIVCLGCSTEPERVEAPNVQPRSIARKSIELYDVDGNGVLTPTEHSCGLRAFAKTADADEDGSLSSDEIANRLQEHVDSKLGLLDVGGIVYMNGEPLPGATVTFIPDPVFGDVLDPAVGESDEFGFVELTIEGNDMPGVKPGFYRVEVRKSAGGNETVAAQYNAESILGEEVGPNVSQGGWKLELTQ